MTRSAQISFGLLIVALLTIMWLNLGTLLLTSLLGYFALKIFSIRGNRIIGVALYCLAVIVIGTGLLYFASVAYRTFSGVADTAIPAMVEFAEKHGFSLPFTDYASLKNSLLAEARAGIAIIGRYARIASFQSLLLGAGLVVALGVFLNPRWTAGNLEAAGGEDLYTQITREFGLRFKNLYQSFAAIMGAQILIAAINTALTAVFLFFYGYPYSALLLPLVFLCGLIPIVGNLISNTVIVGVGFTISPKTGLVALIFLVLIHKLEYFLDSTIIGRRIHSPVWLMLIALLLGERLMGLPGMVLAPVMLHYIKCELSGYPPLPGEKRPRPSMHAQDLDMMATPENSFPSGVEVRGDIGAPVGPAIKS